MYCDMLSSNTASWEPNSTPCRGEYEWHERAHLHERGDRQLQHNYAPPLQYEQASGNAYPHFIYEGYNPHPYSTETFRVGIHHKAPQAGYYGSAQQWSYMGSGERTSVPTPNPVYREAYATTRRGKKTPRHSVHGRKGDPRMHAAVAARLADPGMPLLDALIKGGFVFRGLGLPGASDNNILDDENVLLYQRKNQLNRRLRLAKNKVNKENQTKKTTICKGKKAKSQDKTKPSPSTAEGSMSAVAKGKPDVARREDFEPPFSPISISRERARPESELESVSKVHSLDTHINSAINRRDSFADCLDAFFLALPEEVGEIS